MLRERLLTAGVLLPVVVGALLLGKPWLMALVLVVAALAAYEVFAMLQRQGRPVLPILGVPLAVAVTASGLGPGEPDLFAFTVAASLILTALAGLCHPDPKTAAEAWQATLFGALYVGLLAFTLVILMRDPALPGGAPLAWLGGGRGWFVVLLAGVWAFDSLAYTAGRLFGRHRFMERISPKKTWEGVIGGLIGATALSGLALWGLGRSPLEGLLLGPLVAVSAQAGDLAESLLKRACGVKDSGRLFPGHGGMLDRVDSFLFAAPAVALYVSLVTR
jgi:phosphatidate cytidylyltransferase